MDTLGKLYLIPTTLGDSAPLEVMPISVKKVVEEVNHFIAENEKSARRFIKAITPTKSQPSLHFSLLNKYTNEAEIMDFLNPCFEGKNMGLMSDAGCPAIADPGAVIVNIAHQKGIQVIPMVGPSSILMAMMASGFNGQNFAFNGYLPIERSERKKKLKSLERISREQGQSQIFIETPYRNNKIIDDVCAYLNGETKVCVACDLTLSTEYIKTKKVSDWKHSNEDLHKRPAIFIIQG